MNDERTHPATTGLNIGDIYHVLFRHKWKILLVWIVGLTATAIFRHAWPVPYQSEAKLYLKYIVDNKTLTPGADESSIRTLDFGSMGVVNSEIEILTTLDLAQQVADAVGPERILANLGGGTNRLRAAAVVKSGVTADLPQASGIIHVVFQHPDRDIVQPVLSKLIDLYQKKHAEIGMDEGAWYDVLRQAKDDSKSQLAKTEKDLREAQTNAGINSSDDIKNLSAAYNTFHMDLINAEVELTEHQAQLDAMMKILPTNTMLTTLQPTNTVPEKIVQKYRLVRSYLESAQKKEQDLIIIQLFKTNSDTVKFAHAQVEDLQTQVDEIEHDYQQLTQITPAASLSPVGEQPIVSRAALFAETTRITGLQMRTNALNQQLKDVGLRLEKAEDGDATIRQLRNNRDQQQKNLDYITQSLQRLSYDEALSAGRNFNISPIQSPTPPGKDTAKLDKTVRIMALGTLVAGIALAFLIEMILDRSLKRPVEVEAKTGLPLMMSIPRTNMNGKHRGFGQILNPVRLLQWTSRENQERAEEPVPVGPPPNLPLKAIERLNPFFEALRDRLIMMFEMKNLTYKPKLVAVTSCGNGAGVTTVASGLAASLSETGEGNVLLVDMNIEGGAAHYFHKGELHCGLDEALEMDKRGDAMVQDKLYVVSGNPANDKLPRILHKRFSSLMPKLKASDYDYIIFDLPPVSQISPTSRVARYMDLVLLVIESEKTDRDVVKRAGEMLTESKANVSIVLNKTRTYVPHRLNQNS